MYVCVCNPVSDKQIAQAAREGACCMRDLRERLGVGAQCGKCVPMAKELLREHGTPIDRRASAELVAISTSRVLSSPVPRARVEVLAA